MKEYLNIYESQKEKIEDFLQESLYNLGSLKILEKDNFSELFSLFPSLELIYIIGKDTKLQKSPNYFKKKKIHLKLIKIEII